MLANIAKRLSESFDLQLLASSLIALVALLIGLRALAAEPKSVASRADLQKVEAPR